MAKKKKEKSTAGKLIAGFSQGRIIPVEFLRMHWIIIGLAVILTIFYIFNQYICQTNLEQIKRLQVSLNNAKTDCVKASSEFKSQIRETKMKNLVDTMHLQLTNPDQPPYKITEK